MINGLASALLPTFATNATAPSRFVDPLELCHPGQREAVADGALSQAWITTRRAGKTRGEIYALLRAAASSPDVNCLYLTTTIKRAINTIWWELLRIASELKLSAEANGSRHVLRLANGSCVWVSGCETRVEADAWRGVLSRTALVCLDEAQDWKHELLRYTYESVILPSLGDIGGRFILAGTPGAPRGFLFEFARAPGVSTHKWSWQSNPWVGYMAEKLEEAKRSRGCDDSDPSIRREFFGEFVADSNRQIFPASDALLVPVASLPGGKWSYVIGADFGTVDACAAVVWGWVPSDRRLFVVETRKQHGLGASEQVSLVREICRKYDGGLIGVVGDPGGGGAGLIRDLQREHQIAIQAAEKQGKASACVTLRDGIKSGKVAIVETERAFVRELEEPEWDPEKIGEVIRGHMPDRVDAALYGWRRAIGLHHYEAPPVETRPQWQVDQERELDALQAADDRTNDYLKQLGVM